MKKMKVSVVALCCFMIVSACSNKNPALQSPSTSLNTNQETPSAYPSTGQPLSSSKADNKNETEVGDIAENKAEAEEITVFYPLSRPVISFRSGRKDID